MKHKKIGKIITGILMIFVFSLIFPACATTNVSEVDTTRQSLMMMERTGFCRGKKQVSSRAYKKSKKKGAKYKKSKHKHKKRRQKKWRR